MMRRSQLVTIFAAALPAVASAQERALTVTPRAGYVLGSSVYSQLFAGEKGGWGKDELRADGHLEVALTAAYRLGRSPFSLFADAGTGASTAVQHGTRVRACVSLCTADEHRLLVSTHGPITLWHAAAGVSLRVEDRRGSGGTMNLMLGSVLSGAEFKEDFAGNAWTPQSFRGGGYFLGADVTHPLTRRVQLRGGVSDLITRLPGPTPDVSSTPDLNIVNPTVHTRRYTNRVRFTAGVSVGL